MSAYDLREPDHYTSHLAELNATRAVIATEDIYNRNGVLLVKKGLPIQPEVARKLLQHKLKAPMDTLVNVDDAITPKKLYVDCIDMLNRMPGLQALHHELGLDGLLQEQCHFYARFPLISQKITVLSERMPETYRKGLFCAWMSLAILREQVRPHDDLTVGFLAGLVHDAGMLHLDPTIIDKTTQYTAEEWRRLSPWPVRRATLSYWPDDCHDRHPLCDAVQESPADGQTSGNPRRHSPAANQRERAHPDCE